MLIKDARMRAKKEPGQSEVSGTVFKNVGKVSQILKFFACYVGGYHLVGCRRLDWVQVKDAVRKDWRLIFWALNVCCSVTFVGPFDGRRSQTYNQDSLAKLGSLQRWIRRRLVLGALLEVVRPRSALRDKRVGRGGLCHLMVEADDMMDVVVICHKFALVQAHEWNRRRIWASEHSGGACRPHARSWLCWFGSSALAERIGWLDGRIGDGSH